VRRGCGLAVAKGQRGGTMRACERHQDRRLTGGNAVVPVRPENWKVCSSPDPPRPPGQQGGKERAGKTRRRPMWKERGGGGGRVPKETVRLWGGSGRRWGAERAVAPDQVRREATAREDAGARAARRPEGWIGGSPTNPAAQATGAHRGRRRRRSDGAADGEGCGGAKGIRRHHRSPVVGGLFRSGWIRPGDGEEEGAAARARESAAEGTRRRRLAGKVEQQAAECGGGEAHRAKQA
jgi:hypothetical protein